MNANKRVLQWGVASLLLILACACGGRSNIPLPPIEKRAEYKLPIIDYDFDGGVNKIIKFEAQQGHRYNMAESDATTLVFTTGDEVYPQTVYRLENQRIIEVYQPCTKGDTLKKDLSKIDELLKAKGWSEWANPVQRGECEAAYLQTRTINGQSVQIASALIRTTTNHVKKTTPGVTFLFARVQNDIDYSKVRMPEIDFDAVSKTKDELKAYLEGKGQTVSFSSSFLRVKVDNVAFNNEVLYYIPEGEEKCSQIILTSVSFVLNKSENITNQLKERGFEFNNETNLIRTFYNETQDLWALVRIYPANQFTQPNIVFTKKIQQ